MNQFFNYMTQASTWEGVVTGALTVAAVADAVATGGLVSGTLGVIGAIASATSVTRDDRKKG